MTVLNIFHLEFKNMPPNLGAFSKKLLYLIKLQTSQQQQKPYLKKNCKHNVSFCCFAIFFITVWYISITIPQRHVLSLDR